MQTIKSLYDTITAIEGKYSAGDEQVGYLLVQAISSMKSKKGKFISRTKEGTPQRSLRNMQRAFVKSARQFIDDVVSGKSGDSAGEKRYWQAVETARNILEGSEVPDYLSVNTSGGYGPVPSVEKLVLSGLYQIIDGGNDAGEFLAKLGANLKRAEQIYHRFVDRSGEHYANEYKLWLSYLNLPEGKK